MVQTVINIKVKRSWVALQMKSFLVFTLPAWMKAQIDHGWRSRGAHCFKPHKAAFFSFLLPAVLKVLRLHPPAAFLIDGALLMGRHLLASVRSLKTFLYMAQSWGWSLFSSALQDFIHYWIACVCVVSWWGYPQRTLQVDCGFLTQMTRGFPAGV